MNTKIDILCVGFNAHNYYDTFVSQIRNQKDVDLRILILEQGPVSPHGREDAETYHGPNLGYGRGNNVLLERIRPDCDFVAILNPDCFPINSEALSVMVSAMNDDAGLMMTQPRLLGFDYKRKCGTGLVDSLGIRRTWYGRWYDVEQGQAISDSRGQLTMECHALCGAFLLMRREVISLLSLKRGWVFHPRYFMYKEDIELSQQIKGLGFRVAVVQRAAAYHCRGWHKRRRDMPWSARWHSALNEIDVNKQQTIPLLYSITKLIYVIFVEWPIYKMASSAGRS